MNTRTNPTAEWIAYVDQLRITDDLILRGDWHGYTDAPGGAAPMRGEFYLVRWLQPTIAVSDNDREHVLDLARLIEQALTDHA